MARGDGVRVEAECIPRNAGNALQPLQRSATSRRDMKRPMVLRTQADRGEKSFTVHCTPSSVTRSTRVFAQRPSRIRSRLARSRSALLNGLAHGDANCRQSGPAGIGTAARRAGPSGCTR